MMTIFPSSATNNPKPKPHYIVIMLATNEK